MYQHCSYANVIHTLNCGMDRILEWKVHLHCFGVDQAYALADLEPFIASFT
jgi:hypothetical protein